MKLNTSEILDQVCRKIGTTRKHPKSNYLSKREALVVLTWINTVNDKMDLMAEKIKKLEAQHGK